MNQTKRQIDPAFVFEVLLYRWKLWLIPLILSPLVALAVFSLVPKRFKSSTKIMVQEGGVVNPFLSGIMGAWSLKRLLPVIETILQNDTDLEQVLGNLGEIQKFDPPPTIRERVNTFRHQISVYELGGGLINIDLVGNSPAFVQKGLEFLVDNLISEIRRPQKESVEDATRFLQKELDRLRRELEEAEGKVAQFKREHANELPEFQRVNLDVYLSYHRALMEAEIKLQESRRKKRLLEDRLQGFKQTELLGKQHHNYKRALKEVNALTANVKMLRNRLDESKALATSAAENEKILSGMIRDIEIKSKVYRSLLERHEDSQVTKALALYDEGNKIWVVQAASLPKKPFSPGLMMVLLGSGLGGVIFGLLLVFAAEFFTTTIRQREEIEQLTGIPVIGTIPNIKPYGS